MSRKPRTTAEKVDAILAAAEDHYDFGGGENEHGMLEPGSIDWRTLRARVARVVKADIARRNKIGKEC